MFGGLVVFLLAADPSCLPVPESVGRLGEDAVNAWRDELSATVDAVAKDAKAPRFTHAPRDARPLLALIWANQQRPEALRRLMEQSFTWSFGGDRDADQAVREWKEHTDLLAGLGKALSGSCKREEQSLTCQAKGTPRLVLELQGKCWRWTAFVAGD